MPEYKLLVNDKEYTVNVSADMPLLWVLRDHLNLLGTKYGCGIGECGACTVHIDGVAMRSCITFLPGLDGKKITTIEGLSKDNNHPVQQAWKELDVPQCGYCQAGQIMTAAAFLDKNPNPSNTEIKNAMHGNLCRCGSYTRIEKAVAVAAKKLG